MSNDEREFWNALIDEAIHADKDFLVYVGSENRN